MIHRVIWSRTDFRKAVKGAKLYLRVDFRSAPNTRARMLNEAFKFKEVHEHVSISHAEGLRLVTRFLDKEYCTIEVRWHHGSDIRFLNLELLPVK